MKKVSSLKILFYTLILAFVVPTSTFASELETYGAGQWDVIFDKNVTATSSGTNTSTFTSGGGDIRVCIGGVDPANSVSFQFFRSTGAIGPIMFSENANSSPTSDICLPKIDIRPYVDSTGKIDLYLKVFSKNKSSDTVHIVVED